MNKFKKGDRIRFLSTGVQIPEIGKVTGFETVCLGYHKPGIVKYTSHNGRETWCFEGYWELVEEEVQEEVLEIKYIVTYSYIDDAGVISGELCSVFTDKTDLYAWAINYKNLLKVRAIIPYVEGEGLESLTDG
jgi:hypothetical protein